MNRNNKQSNNNRFPGESERFPTNHRPRRDYDQIWRSCNICGTEFIQDSEFDRFCEVCRNYDELYQYADWAAFF
jgi:hypothetical protein